MFDLTKYTKVYVPSISNSPKEFRIISEDTQYPIRIGDMRSTTKDGKNHFTNPNPVVFPYTQEWYDKLKVVYPDLKPYVADYRVVIKSILKNCDAVVCKVSYISFDRAITGGDIVTIHRNTILSDNLYYVPVNPYTLKPCNSDTDYYVLPDLYIPF